MDKIPVARRAVLARLNRRLAKEHKVLKQCRADSRWHGELGDLYAVDMTTDTISAKHVGLENWAREYGVLKPSETIVSD